MAPHPAEVPPCPLTGAYYWVPIPPLRSLTWRILACHDLGFDEDQSHYDQWPKVVAHLAGLWGRDPKVFRRYLGKHCYGLPRGRVTNPDKVYLILHGKDSPVADWKERVIQRFNLRNQRVRLLFDEHEQRMSADIKVVEKILGLSSGVPRFK